jgi:hypothetical protein
MRTPFIFITLVSFIMTSLIGPVPQAMADDLYLPAPGVMVHLSPGINPPLLKGIKVHPDHPFRFDFILDKGDSRLSNGALKEESSKLIKYFLAGLTIPEKDLWVNLSPYEKDRIIPPSFGLTEMGRDLLAEDYMLKQITASLIYPEDEIGKKFWKRIYEEAAKRYGTTNIPVNTFNKVWIVPQKAVVYENAKAGTAYVVESKLKVMLEQDYLSMSKHENAGVSGINRLGSDIVREIVIPELSKEVNENGNFARLRQVYNSLILATWYKKKIKDSILERVYADRNKVAGVNINDPLEKQRIYERYLRAFKKGVFNYIKEETDILSQENIPRKYFSGGVTLLVTKIDFAQASQVPESLDRAQIITVDLATAHTDRAMVNTGDTVGQFIQRLESDFIRNKISINTKIDPRNQRLLINHRILTPLINSIAVHLPIIPIESDQLSGFIQAMDNNENPLVENQRSNYTYNLLLLAVKNKNRGIWNKWLERANEGMEEVASENQKDNEQYAVTSDALRLRLPMTIELDQNYILKLRSDTRWGELKRTAFIVCEIVEKVSRKDVGRIDLGFDENTSSWLAVDPHGFKINDQYRGQYLGRKAYFKLVETLGVIRSAGMTPDVTSPDAQNMWEKMGAKVEYVGNYYAPYLFSNALGWSWVIRGDKAQLASGLDRRGFLKMAGILAASLALPGFAQGAIEPASRLVTARQMVLDRLESIGQAGKIRTDISSREYWLNEVFKGNQRMYLFAQDDIEIALEAGLKPYFEKKALNAEEFSGLAIQAIKGQTVDSKLKKFFSGSWSRYVVSLANNDKYVQVETDIIRQRAQDIDPAFGEMIDQLVINTSKWDKNDIWTQWQKFNDTFLISRGYYASVTPAVLNGKNFYFALIYHIESNTPMTLPGGKTIDILTARRADHVNFEGDLGHDPIGFQRVFIDLDAIDDTVKLYLGMTPRAILPYTVISPKKLSGIINWLYQIKAKGSDNLTEIMLNSTRKHEIAHKIYEGFQNVQLTDGFGLSQPFLDGLRKTNPDEADRIQSEVYAYLSEIRGSNLPGIEIFDLFRFFMSGSSTFEFYTACFILNQMTGKELDPGNPDEVVEQVDQLLHLPDAQLSQKAVDILNKSFPQRTGVAGVDQAMINGGDQKQIESSVRQKDYPELAEYLNSMGYEKVKPVLKKMLERFLNISSKDLANEGYLEYPVYDKIMGYLESRSTKDALQAFTYAFKRSDKTIVVLYVMGRADDFLSRPAVDSNLVRSGIFSKDIKGDLRDMGKRLLYYTDPEQRSDVRQKARSLLNKIYPLLDRAMTGNGPRQRTEGGLNPGGIDLNAVNKDLQVNNNGIAIKFHLDGAMLQQLQNAPGFVPVIINIQPLIDLHKFLGINDPLTQ